MVRTIVLSFVILLCSGCLEMVTPSDVVTTQSQIDALRNSIDTYQGAVSSISTQLEKDKLISSEAVNRVDELSKKVDELQPTVEDAIQAVLDAEYSGDKVGDILVGVQAANKATSTINPYSGAIDTGLSILMGVLGVGAVGGTAVAVKKGKENHRIVAAVNKIAAEASSEEGVKLNSAVNGK